MTKKKLTLRKKTKTSVLPENYPQLIKDLKEKIYSAQIKTALSVNQELLKLYWDIGLTIAEKQKNEKWGSHVIERLAKDLQKEFPGIEGFSRSNIFYIRSFYLAYVKVQQPAGQFQNLPIFHIPWWHNVILITKLKDTQERL